MKFNGNMTLKIFDKDGVEKISVAIESMEVIYEYEDNISRALRRLIVHRDNPPNHSNYIGSGKRVRNIMIYATMEPEL